MVNTIRTICTSKRMGLTMEGYKRIVLISKQSGYPPNLSIKTLAPRLSSMLPWFRVGSAMFWFQIMNTANVFVLIGQFPEPRASFNVIMGDGVNPDVINEMVAKLNGVYPFKYVIPACLLPHLDILIGGTCWKGIEVQAAMTALFAFKALRWHFRYLIAWMDWFSTFSHTILLTC